MVDGVSGPSIHPSARVHRSVVIEGEVVIGAHCEVGPHCYLVGPLSIGEGTLIRAGSIIGTPAEHDTRKSEGPVLIGRRVRIGELAVIQRGTGDRITEVNDDCFFMDHLHIGHDSVIGRGVITAPNVVLAGHTRIHAHAKLGSGVVTHQFTTIGAYSMIGMASALTRDVQPFSLVKGNPARFSRIHLRAFEGLPFGADALTIRDGLIESSHPEANPLFVHFQADVRRKILKTT